MTALDKFTRAYIEAALWSSNDNSDEQGGDPLDSNYSADDIAPEALERIKADCAKFQAENAADIEAMAEFHNRSEWTYVEQAGHDFWLTRCGHGAGFWDRGMGELGEKLTAASKAYGECDLYVGDDGKLYI